MGLRCVSIVHSLLRVLEIGAIHHLLPEVRVVVYLIWRDLGRVHHGKLLTLLWCFWWHRDWHTALALLLPLYLLHTSRWDSRLPPETLLRLVPGARFRQLPSRIHFIVVVILSRIDGIDIFGDRLVWVLDPRAQFPLETGGPVAQSTAVGSEAVPAASTTHSALILEGVVDVDVADHVSETRSNTSTLV